MRKQVSCRAVPSVASSFHPPLLLRGGHVATIAAALRPRPAAAWTERERLELEDGDFLDLAWRRQGSKRLAVLCHGLEGSLDAPYIRGMAEALAHGGWDVLAWNCRNCGPEPNRLPRSYHSGESGDLRTVVNHGLAAGSRTAAAVVGFSLGGNIALKYAGEAPPHPLVRAVVAISAPVDLASCARALDGRLANRFYRRRFLRTLTAKALAKARRFPGSLDARRIRRVRTIREFDDCVTAPLHGFEDAVDYWTRASSLPLISRIPVPSLLLSAANDPLLDAPCYPERLAADLPRFYLETPPWGGHVGFSGATSRGGRWHERRVLDFLESMTAGPPVHQA
ncbi:MAG: alpha/beta fold hydrolase [Verrucomicrobiaceae bacterium]|nr:MAG: alpha/beta fold hydrolase [Verrucomicrobiaceae bacterium]